MGLRKKLMRRAEVFLRKMMIQVTMLKGAMRSLSSSSWGRLPVTAGVVSSGKRTPDRRPAQKRKVAINIQFL